MNVLSLVAEVSFGFDNTGGDLQSQWARASLLHDLVDIFCLEVVLEERIMEELPLDLGNLDLAGSLLQLLLVLGGIMG